ncbi:dual adapter for phosphotyrosine and 3-phosphotyrosine and 3-phosphoinositide-like [Oscarella lobularis]|uniref:dual adapter for phosphotyrosine and 3-phosphotyrosine and 3-phosphoinositide-like n=1 Tax=Oscarella lobularis TaxID=121494 RepID=UPI0033137E18
MNQEIQQLDWFHPNCTRHIAESLLTANGKDGSYLLRPSGNSGAPFTLSVRCRDAVKHYPIDWDGRTYEFGMGRFSSLKEFVDHFESRPLIGDESRNLTMLRFPYPNTVAEPASYDTVRMHTEMRSTLYGSGGLGAIAAGEAMSDDKSPVLSIGSKEGYLTKLGKVRKSWKTRWFVLRRNELKYYRDPADPQPVRTIDLGQCTDVSVDSSQNKENCFRLVSPHRTFFMFASSKPEMTQWLDLLQWKMANKGK